MKIKHITKSEFAKYGTVIEYDSCNQNSFQIVLAEEDATGWRIAVSKITTREVSKLGRHPNSRESFEPVEGTTLIYVAEEETPEKFEVFLLDKPVCLYKNIWHATSCLSEYSVVKIVENLKVESSEYILKT